MRGTKAVFILTCIAFLHSDAAADRVRWEVADGGNGHWYEALTGPEVFPGVPRSVPWAEANFHAQALGGHLATITSAAENEFVFSLIDKPLFWRSLPRIENFGPWLGGLQSPDARDPAEGWSWVTGEPFEYTHWHPGEPNDLLGNLEEDRLIFFAIEDSTGARSAFWNDESDFARNPVAYVVEYVPEPASLVLFHVLSVAVCLSSRNFVVC